MCRRQRERETPTRGDFRLLVIIEHCPIRQEIWNQSFMSWIPRESIPDGLATSRIDPFSECLFEARDLVEGALALSGLDTESPGHRCGVVDEALCEGHAYQLEIVDLATSTSVSGECRQLRLVKYIKSISR